MRSLSLSFAHWIFSGPRQIVPFFFSLSLSLFGSQSYRAMAKLRSERKTDNGGTGKDGLGLTLPFFFYYLRTNLIGLTK